MANGLTGIDFVPCWISWSVLPLSRRPSLMCEYIGGLKDPQRHIDIQLTEDEVTEAVKKMLDEPVEVCSRVGLSPFYASNKLPGVRIFLFCFNPFRLNHSSIICFNMRSKLTKP